MDGCKFGLIMAKLPVVCRFWIGIDSAVAVLFSPVPYV
jgi:hypothetical protein